MFLLDRRIPTWHYNPGAYQFLARNSLLQYSETGYYAACVAPIKRLCLFLSLVSLWLRSIPCYHHCRRKASDSTKPRNYLPVLSSGVFWTMSRSTATLSSALGPCQTHMPSPWDSNLPCDSLNTSFSVYRALAKSYDTTTHGFVSPRSISQHTACSASSILFFDCPRFNLVPLAVTQPNQSLATGWGYYGPWTCGTLIEASCYRSNFTGRPSPTFIYLHIIRLPLLSDCLLIFI